MQRVYVRGQIRRRWSRVLSTMSTHYITAFVTATIKPSVRSRRRVPVTLDTTSSSLDAPQLTLMHEPCVKVNVETARMLTQCNFYAKIVGANSRRWGVLLQHGDFPSYTVILTVYWV